MKKHILLFSILSLISIGINAQLTSTTLFKSQDTPSKIFYRIPALATCKDGSLIAICDERLDVDKDVHSQVNIRLIGRKSYDNGITWSDPFYIAGDKNEHLMAGDENNTYKAYSDPAIVVDRSSGKIVVFCVHGCNIQEARASKNMRPNLVRIESNDNGKSWSKPEKITSQFFGADYKGGKTKDGKDPQTDWCYQFFPSGKVLQLRDGRLAVAMFASDANAKVTILPPSITYTTYNYLYISDDLGKTWQLKGNCAMNMGDEAKLEELEDGRLLISSRLSNKAGRGYNYYNPQTELWGTSTYSNNPITAQCNGEIKVLSSKANGHTSNRMLFSIPNNANRQNISLFYSYDEGRSWTLGKSILPGVGDYSTLTILADNSIGIFYEESFVSEKGTKFFKLNFARLTLEELTQYKDYMNVHITEQNNPLMSVALKGIDGNLEIEASIKTVIENNPNDLPVKGKTLIHRTIEGSKWHALSFPFDIEKVFINFDEDNRVEIKSLLTAAQEEVASLSYFNLQEYREGAFRECESIKANTPYLFRLPASIYQLDLIFTSEKAICIAAKNTNEETVPSNGVQFCAAANNLNTIDKNNPLILNEDGTAFVRQFSASIYPFEAYMMSENIEIISTPSLTNNLAQPEDLNYIAWSENGCIQILPKEAVKIVIHNMQGEQIWIGEIDSLTEFKLPNGVYFINRNKKIRI